MENLKVYKTEETAIIEVICSHPEDNNRYYTFVVVIDESPIFFTDEEYYGKIREEIEKQVNPSGYFHDVEIILNYNIMGKLYKKAI